MGDMVGEQGGEGEDARRCCTATWRVRPRGTCPVDGKEREARAKLNEQGKPEVVREAPAKPLERGDIVRCDLSSRSVTSREYEARCERANMEREIRRELDKDRGWER